MKLIKPNYVWMTLMQLALPLYIYLGIGYSWYWWLVAFIFYFLYLCIGNNIGMHRYFSHGYFKMSKPMEYFVAFLSTMACLGSPLSYVSVHNIHHRYNDTEDDIHGRPRGWKSILFIFHKEVDYHNIVKSKNLTRLMTRYCTLHNYYWLVVATGAFLFYLISWELFLFAWCIPVSLTLWAVALVLLLQHDKKGPSNTRSYMWFGFGETWHKNHHDNPGLVDHSLGKGKDWTYEISKLLSK